LEIGYFSALYKYAFGYRLVSLAIFKQSVGDAMPFSRFCSDIFLSSIFIIPLGFWLSQVAGQLMTPITNHSFKAESQL
jgi:hypothetical protein